MVKAGLRTPGSSRAAPSHTEVQWNCRLVPSYRCGSVLDSHPKGQPPDSRLSPHLHEGHLDGAGAWAGPARRKDSFGYSLG